MEGARTHFFILIFQRSTGFFLLSTWVFFSERHKSKCHISIISFWSLISIGSMRQKSNQRVQKWSKLKMINKSQVTNPSHDSPKKYTNTTVPAEARVFTHKKPILPHCGLYSSLTFHFFPMKNFYISKYFKASKVNSSGVLRAHWSFSIRISAAMRQWKLKKMAIIYFFF